MDKKIVFSADLLEQTEKFARQLVGRTLAPLESAIDLVAVRVKHAETLPVAIGDYHCTIFLKVKDGTTVRAEAIDCDNILAVYRALSKIMDQVPRRNAT